jgi:5'-nucleotidase
MLISFHYRNDDGWAEANMRALFASLEEAGHNVYSFHSLGLRHLIHIPLCCRQVVLSAPTQNESGTGSLDVAPLLPITLVEGQYNTIPVGSPSEGSNSTDRELLRRKLQLVNMLG